MWIIYSVIWISNTGIKFREDFYWEVFKLAIFFTNAKNEKLKTRENKYITILITNYLMRLSMT